MEGARLQAEGGQVHLLLLILLLLPEILLLLLLLLVFAGEGLLLRLLGLRGVLQATTI